MGEKISLTTVNERWANFFKQFENIMRFVRYLRQCWTRNINDGHQFDSTKTDESVSHQLETIRLIHTDCFLFRQFVCLLLLLLFFLHGCPCVHQHTWSTSNDFDVLCQLIFDILIGAPRHGIFTFKLCAVYFGNRFKLHSWNHFKRFFNWNNLLLISWKRSVFRETFIEKVFLWNFKLQSKDFFFVWSEWSRK